jgi:hypothetical protein
MEAKMLGYGKILLALALTMAAPVATMAQTTDNQPAPSGQPSQPPPSKPAAQAPASPPVAQPQAELLKPEQLEALVAPIALYPDELLANVLAASTYPLEVVQADRWVKGNKSLKGDAQKAAVEKQQWDDSVKALVSTADVLTMMSDKIDWTKDLGDAMLAQQADVMDAVQRLRAKAQKNNKLVTTKQQKVTVQKQQNKEVIVIEPAQPDTMYVPYYDPATVYGAWPYATYPPYYFGYPSYIGAGVIAAGLAFGTAWAIGRWGNYWGGGCGWGNNNININRNTINNIGGGNWQHNPAHRGGVKYANQNVANRFGNNNARAGASDRMNYRGRDGQQVVKPGGDRPGGADRAGDRGGDRAGAADRSKGGDRAGAGDRAKGGGDHAKGGGDRAKGAGDRAKGGGGNRAAAADRARGPAAGGGRDSALGGMSGGGRAANVASARGQMSMGGRGGGGGAPAFAGGGGGGGFSGGGGRGGGGFGGGGGRGGGGGGGGGRRSDIALKHDVVLLGHLENGLGYYRFSYLGSQKAYVGVMAQEVLAVLPDAVTRGSDGYLRVYYDRLGLKFHTYHDWLAAGGRIPTRSRI